MLECNDDSVLEPQNKRGQTVHIKGCCIVTKNNVTGKLCIVIHNTIKISGRDMLTHTKLCWMSVNYKTLEVIFNFLLCFPRKAQTGINHGLFGPLVRKPHDCYKMHLSTSL